MVYIIISSIDWLTHWQMHHQLATSLIREGHRVLFVENTGVRSPQLKDVGRIAERIRNWFSSLVGFKEVLPDLFVYSPAFLPFPSHPIAVWLNARLIFHPLHQWMRAVRCSEPVVISFLPTPLIQALIEKINPRLTVYYCANHMAGSSPATMWLRPWEDLFFSKSDAVFSISGAIADRAASFNRFVYSFPAGVDIEKFNPESEICRNVPVQLASLPRPIVGYIGAISEVFDKGLIIDVARALPEATVLLVGPKYTDMSFLEGIANIIWIDQQPHEMIPAYISGFDVALIPYVVNDFTDSVYSCKLNEYLAMGVPVVTTNLREVRSFGERYPGSVAIGNDSAEFISRIRHILDEPASCSECAREKRRAIAMENTWDRRFSGIMDSIEHLLQLKARQPLSWQESLSRYYHRARFRIVTALIALSVLWLVVFYSPLIWLLGDQLVVRQEPRKAGAIVVFSGDGETSYRNDSYQRRALDAIHLYRQGYASDVYLSSGREQELSEVEIIKLYLLENGVKQSSIHILGKYPHSTYENVLMVSRELLADGVHSILFLTSPYHGRRALWIWRKQAPSISVAMPAVVDTPSSRPQWHVSIDQIRVIAYEYAAIAYNWLKGWL